MTIPTVLLNGGPSWPLHVHGISIADHRITENLDHLVKQNQAPWILGP